eukprot:2423980-Rhodomonas_salina.1
MQGCEMRRVVEREVEKSKGQFGQSCAKCGREKKERVLHSLAQHGDTHGAANQGAMVHTAHRLHVTWLQHQPRRRRRTSRVWGWAHLFCVLTPAPIALLLSCLAAAPQASREVLYPVTSLPSAREVTVALQVQGAGLQVGPWPWCPGPPLGFAPSLNLRAPLLCFPCYLTPPRPLSPLPFPLSSSNHTDSPPSFSLHVSSPQESGAKFGLSISLLNASL